jgi:hypothetical protein
MVSGYAECQTQYSSPQLVIGTVTSLCICFIVVSNCMLFCRDKIKQSYILHKEIKEIVVTKNINQLILK